MAPSNDTIFRDDGSWITDGFLEEIFEKDGPGHKVSIVSKDIKLAVSKGDNYLSLIYRVEVHYRRENCKNIEKCHLIVKGFPDGEFIQKFIVETGVFDRELSIYHVALPQIYKFAENNLQNRPVPQISAKAFITSRADTIVMEDLKYDGFVMANRKAMLDLEHCRLVVRNMAHLHGMSAAFHQHNPHVISKYSDNIFSDKNREHMEKFVPLQMEVLLKTVRTWPDFETYAVKLEKYIPVAIDKITAVCRLKEDGFNVLNHGDCWTNNYLFKYSEEGVPTDVRFVDFQLSRIGTPALDLSYFLHTSPQNKVRELHLDELLREYHTELCETLTALGCDAGVFSFQDLQDEMKRVACYGFLAATNIMPIVVADVEDVPDLAEITEEEINKGDITQWEKIPNNPRFRDVFQQMLPMFDKLGVFD